MNSRKCLQLKCLILMAFILSGCATRMVWNHKDSDEWETVRQLSDKYHIVLIMDEAHKLLGVKEAERKLYYSVNGGGDRPIPLDLAFSRYVLEKYGKNDGSESCSLLVDGYRYDLKQAEFGIIGKVNEDIRFCKLDTTIKKESSGQGAGLIIGKTIATPFSLVADIITLPFQFFFWDHDF